jgi:signal transduction histidine kinase
METLKQEIRRLNELIEKFLAVARANRIQKALCDLSSLAKSVTELFRMQAESAKIKLKLNFENAVYAACDADAIRQALINVLKNSIEAIGTNGNIDISISEKNQYAIMSIKDDGPGIKDIALALKPFSTTKRDGTGLGLATASKIISDHGGKLTIESTPGHGCAVNIILPQKDESL